METVSYAAAGANAVLALAVVLKTHRSISRAGAFALGVAAALGVAFIVI